MCGVYLADWIRARAVWVAGIGDLRQAMSFVARFVRICGVAFLKTD
jgi:hypothetical protein